MSATTKAVRLLDTVKADLLRAFSSIPDFGTVGFTVFFNEGEPVRCEWSGSTSTLLGPRAERSLK